MLVLNRKIGERIVIGDCVVVTVLESGRSRVRLGIEAPHEVSIKRHEVLFDVGSSRTGMDRLLAPLAEHYAAD